MNLEQLKIAFPKVYAAAVEVGVHQERDRVGSHIMMGQKTGDIPLALRSIRNGAELVAVMRHYLAGGRNRADLRARLEDNAAVEAALANAKRQSTGGGSQADAVIDRLQRLVDSGADVRIEDLDGGHE
jgi:hypothetical protein